jgi:hypothetical protein
MAIWITIVVDWNISKMVFQFWRLNLTDFTEVQKVCQTPMKSWQWVILCKKSLLLSWHWLCKKKAGERRINLCRLKWLSEWDKDNWNKIGRFPLDWNDNGFELYGIKTSSLNFSIRSQIGWKYWIPKKIVRLNLVAFCSWFKYKLTNQFLPSLFDWTKNNDKKASIDFEGPSSLRIRLNREYKKVRNSFHFFILLQPSISYLRCNTMNRRLKRVEYDKWLAILVHCQTFYLFETLSWQLPKHKSYPKKHYRQVEKHKVRVGLNGILKFEF